MERAPEIFAEDTAVNEYERRIRDLEQLLGAEQHNEPGGRVSNFWGSLHGLTHRRTSARTSRTFRFESLKSALSPKKWGK